MNAIMVCCVEPSTCKAFFVALPYVKGFSNCSCGYMLSSVVCIEVKNIECSRTQTRSSNRRRRRLREKSLSKENASHGEHFGYCSMTWTGNFWVWMQLLQSPYPKQRNERIRRALTGMRKTLTPSSACANYSNSRHSKRGFLSKEGHRWAVSLFP